MLDYRLYWQDPEPFPPSVAHVVATWIGRGGMVGGLSAPDTHKFVIDFVGCALSAMLKDADRKTNGRAADRS